MNKKILKNLSILLIVLFSITLIWAEGGDKKGSLNKGMGSPSYKKFNINNISTWIKNDGESDINPNGNSGFEFPKGSGKTAVFQSGFLWGGKVEGQIRVGGSVYRQGTVPGKILNSGVPWNELIAEDPDAPNVRNYRVRPDIIPPEGPRPGDYIEGDVTSEVNDGEGAAQDIINEYYRDWREWPGADGAPYTDVNDNGIYEPTIDIPGVPGADQTIWFVCNDTDPNQTQFMYGSLPMGIEEQVTVWGYNRTGALGNMLFRKYKIINKSNTSFDSMYVSMWNDPDLGDANDDFVGCDTSLSLTFVYNANASDNIYGRYPAAAGFDFFQGPLVDAPGDSGIFDGKRVYDKRNLPMSAHYFFINPDNVYRDPSQGQYQGTLEWYNLFQGRVGTTGDEFPDPVAGGTTPFALYGDPVTRTGWIDGLQHPPGDRRAGMVSGPFNMAPGDTQEVVVAEIAAGGFAPVDRLGAVQLLKFYDLSAQFAYDNFFSIPPPPPAPQVTAVALDKEVVLHWGGNITNVNATENYNNAGFHFEGYNIYQLPTPSATKDQARLLATFDVINGYGIIFDLEFDITTGTVLTKPVQFGNDFGIQRFFNIKTDAFNSGLPLNNGSRYYFAITAYAYNPELDANNNLENTFIPITVVPQTTDPGVRYVTTHGDTIPTTHVGPSDGNVYPVVIDPNLLTGHNYTVTFAESEGEITWTLKDETTGQVVLENMENQAGDNEYPFTFGVQVKVQGPPPGVKQEDVFSFPDNPELWGWDIPSGTRRWTWAGADGFHFEGFRGAIGWGSPAVVFGIRSEEVVPASELKNVLIKYGTVADGEPEFENPGIDPDNPPADENFSYAYRYLRGATSPPALPEFAPYIVNPAPGYSFQDFKKSAPISVWDVDDPANPRRLAIGYLENNAAEALLDGRYFPGDFNTRDNVAASGPREWLFIFDDDYSETPNPDYMTDILFDDDGKYPVMYFVAAQRRGLVPYSPGSTGEDQLAIFPNKINTPNDVFSFTATAPVNSTELAIEDVKKINIFPNPYYGVNPQEINKYERFVTFNHMPEKATIRIFNLAGQLVRTIQKNSTSQYQRWDLMTDSGLPVASGLYIVYIDMPDLGTTKILKAAIIQEQQILDRF
jgi:hypothetical protein